MGPGVPGRGIRGKGFVVQMTVNVSGKQGNKRLDHDASAAGSENPRCFVQESGRIGKVMQGVQKKDGPCRGVGERQRVGAGGHIHLCTGSQIHTDQSGDQRIQKSPTGSDFDACTDRCTVMGFKKIGVIMSVESIQKRFFLNQAQVNCRGVRRFQVESPGKGVNQEMFEKPAHHQSRKHFGRRYRLLGSGIRNLSGDLTNCILLRESAGVNSNRVRMVYGCNR